MNLSRALRKSKLTLALVILTGAVQAAYPTPGAEEIAFEVHPTPMLNCQKVLEGFLASRPIGEFSLVADPRTSSIVAVGPPEIQAQLARFIEGKTAERMRRYVVEMEVTQMVQGKPREIHPPRQELPFGETGTLNFHGTPSSTGPDWRSTLAFTPEPDPSGNIRLKIRASNHEGAREASVTVRPGENLVIDAEHGSLPGLRDLARELNAGTDQTPYSISLKVAPL